MTEVSGGSTKNPQLARTLGLWAIVGLGLGYMTPTVVFDTFGIVSQETGNVVPTAYLLALVVMVFTAISYGRMTRVFPSAGSAYTYTSETISPNLGFLIGWAALLDYLLLPLVNALIIRSYLYSFFPGVPQWIWVVVYVAVITAMCLFSMTNTSRVNMLLVVFEVVLIGVFLILAAKSLHDGMGNGTIFSTQPLWHEGVHANLVITGATIVAGGTLRIDGNSRLRNTTNTLAISNAGVLEVTAAGTLTNAITIGAGNGVLANSSAGALVVAGAVEKNGTVLASRSGSGTNVFTGVISGASANSDFIVDGGTTVFSNVMTYNGPTIITNGGTLVLGTNNAMPSGSNLILGGGTFRVGVLNYNADSALSMGTLTLTADSTIDLGNFGTSGDRNLVFADSSGPSIVWTPGAVLTITNWQGVALAQSDVTKLLFGTGGLDSDQLAQIRFADQNITGGVLLGLNGELSPIPEADIVYAALALALFILWRERRRLLHFVRSFNPPRH